MNSSKHFVSASENTTYQCIRMYSRKCSVLVFQRQFDQSQQLHVHSSLWVSNFIRKASHKLLKCEWCLVLRLSNVYLIVYLCHLDWMVFSFYAGRISPFSELSRVHFLLINVFVHFLHKNHNFPCVFPFCICALPPSHYYYFPPPVLIPVGVFKMRNNKANLKWIPKLGKISGATAMGSDKQLLNNLWNSFATCDLSTGATDILLWKCCIQQHIIWKMIILLSIWIKSTLHRITDAQKRHFYCIPRDALFTELLYRFTQGFALDKIWIWVENCNARL